MSKALYVVASRVVTSLLESLCDAEALPCRDWDEANEEDCLDKLEAVSRREIVDCCAPCRTRYYLRCSADLLEEASL